MQFTPRHLTRIREIWEAFSQSYNSYSEESPGSKVMGPDQFVVAASQLMEEARREALKEMDEAHDYVKCAVEAEKFPYITSKAKESLEKLRQEYQQTT